MDTAQSHRYGWLWSSGTQCRRACFPTYPQRIDPRMGRGSKDQEVRTSKTMDSMSCPSELLRGFVRKSTWQVADVRRPLVSASQIIQAGSDLFIKNNEAYIMIRKQNENSVLRKEGNVHVLDLFCESASRCHCANQVQIHGS